MRIVLDPDTHPVAKGKLCGQHAMANRGTGMRDFVDAEGRSGDNAAASPAMATAATRSGSA